MITDTDNKIKKQTNYGQLYTATDANTIGFESYTVTEKTETQGSHRSFLPRINSMSPIRPEHELERQDSPSFPDH